MSDENGQSGQEQFASIPTKDQLNDAMQNAARVQEAAAQGGAQPAQPDPNAQPAPAGDEGPKLPEKFKSVDDLVSAYSELESKLGNQAQELGHLRNLNDQLLDTRVTDPHQDSTQDAPTLEVDDVLNDPTSAINQVVAPHVAGTNSRVDALEAQVALGAFQGRHPTFQTDQSDPAFQAFVSGSPYRMNLAQKSMQGDLDAAEELWSAWDENKPASGSDPAQDEANKAAEETAEAMAARGGGEGAASTGTLPIKRADLAKIKLEDEDYYYSPEFQKYVQGMYQRGLVR
jgi:hypothetical protein